MKRAAILTTIALSTVVGLVLAPSLVGSEDAPYKRRVDKVSKSGRKPEAAEQNGPGQVASAEAEHRRVAKSPPWKRRRRPKARVNRRALTLVSADEFAAEPATPEKAIDEAQFAKSLRRLCGWMPPSRPKKWTRYILNAADKHQQDPFLLAALMFRMGRCDAKADELNGLGFTLIPDRMYQRNIVEHEGNKRAAYRYWLSGEHGWHEKDVVFGRLDNGSPARFFAGHLRRPESHLLIAAGLLSMWQKQHRAIDTHFEQVPHRHFVSHFIWGDSVRSHRAEDKILLDRRRLLQYYRNEMPKTVVAFRSFSLGSPLFGAPRVVSSGLGDARDGGARKHRGIDVESSQGEPVLAVADGLVNFAGLDLPGHRANLQLELDDYDAHKHTELGSGGRYVCVLHKAEGTWLRSCYMHLDDVKVERGMVVKRGDVLGTVGRSGMKVSSPHLHLELHAHNELLDASEVLKGILIGHPPKAKRRRRRRPSSKTDKP